MTCLLFRKGNTAKQFTLYFYLLQTGSRSKHLRQFVFSPYNVLTSLSYDGRKEGGKIAWACQCQELWAFSFFFFEEKPYSNSSFWRDGSSPCQELCCVSLAGTVCFLAWPRQCQSFLHRWKWAASYLLCWLFLDDFLGFLCGWDRVRLPAGSVLWGCSGPSATENSL